MLLLSGTINENTGSTCIHGQKLYIPLWDQTKVISKRHNTISKFCYNDAHSVGKVHVILFFFMVMFLVFQLHHYTVISFEWELKQYLL